jgi:hypothetical protein
MGEFKISNSQKALLIEALTYPKLSYDAGYEARRTCRRMVRMGWLKEVKIGWFGKSYFCITDLGQTVARQLGLQAAKADTPDGDGSA